MIGEKAAAVADIAGFGQLWVKTATPCQLWFTDDGGTDVQLGASNPAGNDTEIQFNNSGSFGASSNLTFGATNEGIHVTAADATTIAGIFTGASASSVDLVQFNPNGVTAGERARITSAGEFSNNVGQTGSEVFGEGATATSSNAVIVGNGSTGGINSTIVGEGASGAAGSCTGLGRSALPGAIGVAIGENTATGGSGVSIGWGANTTSHAECVLIGRSTSATAANQFVSGSSSYPINDIYFGKGVTNATPTNYTIHGTGGSGTNIAGGDITYAGGIGTGTGVGGDIIFQYAAAGGSGSTPNSLATAMTIDGGTGATQFSQNVGFYGTAPIAQQTGVGVDAASIHAALVALGLITS